MKARASLPACKLTGNSRLPGCYHAAVRTPVVLSFSGGKDSALALARLMAGPRYEVVSLLATVNVRYQRASLQGIRR